MFASESDAGVRHDIALAPGRQAYLVCIEGSLTLGTTAAETRLQARDVAEVVADRRGGPGYLTLEAGPGGAHFLLIEMKQA